MKNVSEIDYSNWNAFWQSGRFYFSVQEKFDCLCIVCDEGWACKNFVLPLFLESGKNGTKLLDNTAHEFRNNSIDILLCFKICSDTLKGCNSNYYWRYFLRNLRSIIGWKIVSEETFFKEFQIFMKKVNYNFFRK